MLVDDHRMVRRTLRVLLGREGDVEVVTEAGDLVAAIRHVKRHAPHVLLLDVRMPGVLKDHAADDLLLAVRSAAGGEEYISPRIATGLDGLRRTADIDGLSHLFGGAEEAAR